MSEEWKRAWHPLMEQVGRDLAPDQRGVYGDEIERGAVWRYLEPLEFDCPLHFDPEAARAHGHDNIVVPCTAVMSFAIPRMWIPGESLFTSGRHAQLARNMVTGTRSSLEPPTEHVFATTMETEYLGQVFVGDRIRRRGEKLIACTPKETKVGRGAFLTWESEILNQHGHRVAVLRSTIFRYNPHAATEPAKLAGSQSVQQGSEQASSGREQRSLQPSPDATKQRTWDEVAENQPIDAIEFPLSIVRLVIAAGANRDFNSIHHDCEFARATGAPDMYANHAFLQGMWERSARRFIGLEGVIRRFSDFQMRQFNTPGETVVVRGRVRRKWKESGLGFVELEIWSETSRGVSVGPGRIVATMPTRS